MLSGWSNKKHKAVNDKANEAVTHFLLPRRVDFRQTGNLIFVCRDIYGGWGK